MFKRPPLRVATRLVNASLGLGLLFLLNVCQGEDNRQAIMPETGAKTNRSDTLDSADRIYLPAVWQSAALPGDIQSLAVAGGRSSLIAVGYADGALQLLNFDGERITDPAELDIAALGVGQFSILQDTPVTVFPAITRQGELNGLIYGGELDAPLPITIDVGLDEDLLGLCSAAPRDESEGVMRIGFWTREAPNRLQSGRIVDAANQLVLLLDPPAYVAQPIRGCVLDETQIHIYYEPTQSALLLSRNQKRFQLVLDRSGNYTAIDQEGTTKAFSIRNGLTVSAPDQPIAMAGTGDARSGGYPNGVVIIAGETSSEEQIVSFIDPSPLMQWSVPASSARPDTHLSPEAERPGPDE